MMSMMDRKWHLGVVSLTKNMRQIDANLAFLVVKSNLMRTHSILHCFVDMVCQIIIFSHVFLTMAVPNRVFYVVFFSFDAKGVLEPFFCDFFVFSACVGALWPLLALFGALCGPELVFLRTKLKSQIPFLDPCVGPSRGVNLVFLRMKLMPLSLQT